MLMIMCQLVLLYLYVTIKEEKRQKDEKTMLNEDKKETKEKFWQWRFYSDYLLFVCMMAATVGMFTVLLHQNPAYQAFLGYTSSGVEAVLGVPQFLLNYRR